MPSARLPAQTPSKQPGIASDTSALLGNLRSQEGSDGTRPSHPRPEPDGRGKGRFWTREGQAPGSDPSHQAPQTPSFHSCKQAELSWGERGGCPGPETKLTCEEMEYPGARTPEGWARLLSPQTEGTRLAPTGRAQMPGQASRRWNRAAGSELEGLGSGGEPVEPQRASRAVGAISTKIRGSRGCLSSLIMEPHLHGGLAGTNVTKSRSRWFSH